MKKLMFVSAAVAAAMLAVGYPQYTKTLNATYKVKPSSVLGKAGCASCHNAKMGGKLNPYGIDVQKAMKAAKTDAVTAALLKKIEGLDSDKDKKKNGAELKSGTLPGAK